MPQEKRAELQKYDHTVRRLGYEKDPMNKLAVQVFGEDKVDEMISLRMGEHQMQANKKY